MFSYSPTTKTLEPASIWDLVTKKRQAQAELMKQQLANRLSQTELPYAADIKKAELQEKLANAQRQQAMAQLPFGGQQLTGAAGQIMGLEMLAQRYGKDSEQYKSAKQIFDLERRNDISRINYQDKYADSLEKRTSSPMAKLLYELQNIRSGNMPGTIKPTQTPIPTGAGQVNTDVPGYNKKLQDRVLNGPKLPMTREQVDKLKALLNIPVDAANSGATNQIQQFEQAGAAAPQIFTQANQAFDQEIDQAKQSGLNITPEEQEAIAQQYQQQIFGTQPTETQKNNISAFGALFNELGDVKKEFLPAMKYFASLKGKVDFKREQINAALRLPVSEEYRKYDAFKDRISYMTMDSLRKAQATSVVPGYVKETILPLTDPNGDIWADPEQVERRFNAFYEWAEKNNAYGLNIQKKGNARTLKEQQEYFKPEKSSAPEDTSPKTKELTWIPGKGWA